MHQGLRTDHRTAGGLHHCENRCREATIGLRSREEKWDDGEPPGRVKVIDEPKGVNQCGELN